MLVSHAATSIVLARALVSDRDLPLRVGCCTVSEFDRQNDSETSYSWKAVRLVDGSPLSGGAARDWGFEDVKLADGKVVYDPGTGDKENGLDEPVGLQILTSKM